MNAINEGLKMEEFFIQAKDMISLMRDEKEISSLFYKLEGNSEVIIIETGQVRLLNKVCIIKELYLDNFLVKFSVNDNDIQCLSFELNGNEFNLKNCELIEIENMFIEWAKNIVRNE
jgi:hypothetical protein